MNSTTWKRAKQVFHEALERAGHERRDYVASVCSGNRDLRMQVDALLAAHDEAGEFLVSPTVTGADEIARATNTLTASAPTERPAKPHGRHQLEFRRRTDASGVAVA